MGEFLDATQVTPAGLGPGGGQRYVGEVAAGWDIAGNANGGYLMALAVRAMSDATGRPPVSVTGHYLSPGRPGPAEVLVDLHRVGRRTATAGAALRGPDGEILRMLGTFAELREEGPTVVDAAPPELPPLDACVRVAPPGGASGFGDRVELPGMSIEPTAVAAPRSTQVPPV